MSTYLPAGNGAFLREIQDKLRESVSVLDFIPPALHADIIAGVSDDDVTAYIQAALDYAHSRASGTNIGGITVFFPAGRYHLAGQIQNPHRKVSWRGEGGLTTRLFWPAGFADHGVRQVHGLPAGGWSGTRIEGILFDSGAGAAASTKGGWYDRGGHQLIFTDCTFRGWKYGQILDYSSVVTIQNCEYNLCVNGIWLVNGVNAELGNTGAPTGHTNAIFFHDCIWNACTGYGIIDDGGELMSVRGGNVNSGIHFIRCAGRTNLAVDGVYIEGQDEEVFNLTNISSVGASQGLVSSTQISNCLIGHTGSKSVVKAKSASRLTFNNNTISGIGSPVIVVDTLTYLTTFSNSTEREILGTTQPTNFADIGERVKPLSVSADLPPIEAGKYALVNLTAPGFGPDSAVLHIKTSPDLGDDLEVAARFSAANNLRIKVRNVSSATITPPSCTFKVTARA